VTNKRALAVVYGAVIAVLVAYAATYPRFHPPTALSGRAAVTLAAKAASAASSGASVADLAANAVDPLSWKRLSAAQHEALAPLAHEWDHFSDERKRKWIKIASRYSRMAPPEQKRLHARMAEWIRMTPTQRRVARENYQLSKELPLQQRETAWSAYQLLPDEQKKKLAAVDRPHRQTVVSAPPTGRSEIKDLNKLVKARERTPAQAATAVMVASSTAGVTAPAAAPAAASASRGVVGAASAPAPAAPAVEPPKPRQPVPWYFNEHGQ